MNSLIFYEHEIIDDLENEMTLKDRMLRQLEEHRQDVVDLFYGTNIDLTWKSAEALASMWAIAYLSNWEHAHIVGVALKISTPDAYAVLRNINEYDNIMNIRRF